MKTTLFFVKKIKQYKKYVYFILIVKKNKNKPTFFKLYI